MMHVESFYTAADLAKLLSVSDKTIYAWVKKKLIPYYQFGKSIRFNRKDVDKWLESHRKPL